MALQQRLQTRRVSAFETATVIDGLQSTGDGPHNTEGAFRNVGRRQVRDRDADLQPTRWVFPVNVPDYRVSVADGIAPAMKLLSMVGITVIQCVVL